MYRPGLVRAILALSVAVVWCANSTAIAAEPTTITYWTFLDPRKDGPRERALAQVLQSFEQKNPDLKVRVEVLSFQDLTTKLITSVAAGLALKSDQVWGFAEGVGRPYSQVHRLLFPLIWAAGGDVVGKDGKAKFNGPEGVRAVQFFVDLAKVHKIMPPDVAGLPYEERV